jgi:hypothetical protein
MLASSGNLLRVEKEHLGHLINNQSSLSCTSGVSHLLHSGCKEHKLYLSS